MNAFNNRFQSDDDCYAYLAAIKWNDNHYECRKCGNTTFHKGRRLILADAIAASMMRA